MVTLAAFCVFLALALGLIALLGQAEDRATVRASLRRLGGYEVETMREQELTQPIGERIFMPVATSFVNLGKRFTPGDYVEKSRRKLTIAGMPANDHLDRFLAIRTVSLGLIPVWFLLAFFLIPASGRLQLAILASCDSSNSRYRGSEGIGGLQWAFLAAGTGAVVSTLWAVDDDAAARFTARLHAHLLAGRSLSAATRLASVESIGTGEAAWPAFVHYGADVRLAATD